MEIHRIDHVSGKGQYVVLSRFGPVITVTRFGPATLQECERFIEAQSIPTIEAEDGASIASLAGEAYGWFEAAHRVEGDDGYTRLKDGRPEWVYDPFQSALGDFFPDDWPYAAIRSWRGAI